MRRPSAQTIAVLEVFLADSEGWLHGYDIGKKTGLASGTLYPILMRLNDRGMLETRWAESPIDGRPRRHMYRLTSEGRKWAREMSTAHPTTRLRPAEGTS